MCPGFPVVAAGDSSGTVTLLRLLTPKADTEAQEDEPSASPSMEDTVVRASALVFRT